MDRNQTFTERKALIFDFDGVLYPRRDFLLQVYYLFTNFVEYTTGEAVANELVEHFKTEYEAGGEHEVFERVAQKFPVIHDYRENFARLHHQARLPLKLHLYPAMLALLRKLNADHKLIVILTPGDPLMQLNKIRQVDWQGLEQELKVYFEDELYFQKTEPLDFLLESLNLEPGEVSYIGRSGQVIRHAHTLGVTVWTGPDLDEIINANSGQ